MSTVNVSTIYTEYVNATGNVFIGNATSNVGLFSNNTLIVGSDVTLNQVYMNSSYIAVSNTSNALEINSTSISALFGLTLNGVFVDTTDNQVSNYQSFTANGTWTKPAWAQANDLVTIMAWGGGGGGYSNTINAGAGGGGACVVVNLLADVCNSICNVVVGTGGLGANSPNPTSGGSSIFYANDSYTITAYGGAAGRASGGGGGGWFSAGVVGDGGSPLGGASGTTAAASTFGGGGAGTSATANGGMSVYGGGGGTAASTGRGGYSIYGGGGGSYTGLVGSSIFGGNGGSSSVVATAPGGGGGTKGVVATALITEMNGARGEVRVWVQKVT